MGITHLIQAELTHGDLVSAYEFVALSMGTIALASSAIFFQDRSSKGTLLKECCVWLLALLGD